MTTTPASTSSILLDVVQCTSVDCPGSVADLLTLGPLRHVRALNGTASLT